MTVSPWGVHALQTGGMTGISVPAPVQRVVDAINAADTDAFVAAFTDDGFVDDWGRVLRGPEGVRSCGDRVAGFTIPPVH